MPGSGCYGHNGADDVAFEASVIAKAYPERHILLKWTREDEHLWEPYGSASLNKIFGAINDDGEIVYWSAGKAIAIGFGKTPISEGSEIRLADKCNVWGTTSFDLTKLKDTPINSEISIEKY